MLTESCCDWSLLCCMHCCQCWKQRALDLDRQHQGHACDMLLDMHCTAWLQMTSAGAGIRFCLPASTLSPLSCLNDNLWLVSKHEASLPGFKFGACSQAIKEAMAAKPLDPFQQTMAASVWLTSMSSPSGLMTQAPSGQSAGPFRSLPQMSGYKR